MPLLFANLPACYIVDVLKGDLIICFNVLTLFCKDHLNIRANIVASLNYLNYSPFYGFWQSFISIEVCRDCIPALASSCKKTIYGFLCLLIVFLKSKTHQLNLKDVIRNNNP